MKSTGYVTGNPDTRGTLVVVFLRGGADGLHMVAPVHDDAYHRYRPQLALRADETIALDDLFGLHPRLNRLERAYREGMLAVVHRTGSEDDTRSHFEAQDLMEHGGSGGGWLGRYLRHRSGTGAGPLAAVAIGKTVPESLRGAPAAIALESLDTFDFGEAAPGLFQALASTYGPLADSLGQAGRDTLNAVEKIRELRGVRYKPENGAIYSGGSFSDGLAQIAQLIKANVGLEAATIELDGWDAHFAASTLMDPLMEQLGAALDAFSTDLGPAMAQTTVVVMTEFGRRVYENASYGTDHGRGCAMFLLGKRIQGGQVYGGWPGLDNDQLEGPGDLPVFSNYRNVLASVLNGHGGDQCAARVFPGFDIQPLDLYA